MKTRIISAAVFIAICAVLLLTSFYTRVLLILLFAVFALKEMSGALNKANHSTTPVYAYIALGIMALGTAFNISGVWITGAYSLLLLGALSVPVFSSKADTADNLLSLGICLYPLMPMLFIMRLTTLDSGIFLLCVTTGAAAAAICDTFAMLGGMSFGKHKLIPRISPHKTVEGTVCGLLSCFVTAGFLYLLFEVCFVKPGVPYLYYALVCAAASSLGQLGDLVASSFKRSAGLKDYSNLIPGHGGMLDRLDSHLFAIPASAVLLLAYLGLAL